MHPPLHIYIIYLFVNDLIKYIIELLSNTIKNPEINYISYKNSKSYLLNSYTKLLSFYTLVKCNSLILIFSGYNNLFNLNIL